MASTETTQRHGKFYAVLALLLTIWMAGLLAIASSVIPDLYWFSYYSIDYRVGFVRRGLAGELVGLFPSDQYFTGLRMLRWLPTVVYTAALAALGWTILTVSGRSERRVMLAMLIVVLPFGFTFGLFSARPDLIGAAAMVGLAIVLTRARRERTILIAAAGYGALTAILSLAHEATPLLFGLGVLSALAVLGRHLSKTAANACAVVALTPGLITTAAVALFGQRGVSGPLCQSIPRGMVNWPATGRPTVGQILQGYRFDVDYHDWICRNIVPLYDQSFIDATSYVTDIGPVLLLAATAIGIALLVVSILAIDHVAGVSFTGMLTLLRTRPLWVLLGLAMFVPIFMTGVDWIRWWVTIGLNIGVVFILFTCTQPATAAPPTRRTCVVFAIGVGLLAVFPLGILPGFGAPVPV